MRQLINSGIIFIILSCKNIVIYVAFREALALHMAIEMGNVAAVDNILLKAREDHVVSVNMNVDNSGFTTVYYALRDNR